jgi:hypothetical protein
MRLRVLWLGIALMTAPVAARADDGLPFRLSALHWGMSRDDVFAVFPDLAPDRPGTVGVATDQEHYGLEGYRWKLCRLQISVYFVDGRLNAVDLTQGFPTTSDGCARNALYELIERFGEGERRPDTTVGGNTVSARDWCGNDTIASFVDMMTLGVEVDLRQRGGPPVVDLGSREPAPCH